MHSEEQLTCKKKKKSTKSTSPLEDCLASSTEAEYIAWLPSIYPKEMGVYDYQKEFLKKAYHSPLFATVNDWKSLKYLLIVEYVNSGTYTQRNTI